MRSLSELKRTSGRSSREDGEATKARIIEAAGRLFAERGYADTTSKEICEAANTNVTSVNYHFGSRDGLYLTVINAVHDYLLSSQFLNELIVAPLSPREKLERLIDFLASMNFDDNSWQIRLWAREVVSPTTLWSQVICENSMPKMDIVLRVVSDATKIPVGDPTLNSCFLNMMSPFMVLLMTWCSRRGPHKHIFDCDSSIISANVKEFILAGLDRLAEKYAKEHGMSMVDSPI